MYRKGGIVELFIGEYLTFSPKQKRWQMLRHFFLKRDLRFGVTVNRDTITSRVLNISWQNVMSTLGVHVWTTYNLLRHRPLLSLSLALFAACLRFSICITLLYLLFCYFWEFLQRFFWVLPPTTSRPTTMSHHTPPPREHLIILDTYFALFTGKWHVRPLYCEICHYLCTYLYYTFFQSIDDFLRRRYRERVRGETTTHHARHDARHHRRFRRNCNQSFISETFKRF